MSKLPIVIKRVEAYEVKGVLERDPIRACAWALHTSFDISFTAALDVLKDVDRLQNIIDVYRELLAYQTEQVAEDEHE